jgi:hypothetical protein
MGGDDNLELALESFSAALQLTVEVYGPNHVDVGVLHNLIGVRVGWVGGWVRVWVLPAACGRTGAPVRLADAHVGVRSVQPLAQSGRAPRTPRACGSRECWLLGEA